MKANGLHTVKLLSHVAFPMTKTRKSFCIATGVVISQNICIDITAKGSEVFFSFEKILVSTTQSVNAGESEWLWRIVSVLVRCIRARVIL